MDISYRNELMREPTSKAKSALISVVWGIKEGGALDRLTDDLEVPAAEVLVELDELLASNGTFVRPAVDEQRTVLEAFREIVLKRVEREKADKAADRLVRQILKAGIGYRAAQSLFIRALDRQGEKFSMEGW